MSAEPSAAPTTPAYQFTDRSLLRPALTRLWFARLFPLVPRWMAANFVTLLSVGALVSVLVLSLDPQRWSPGLRAIVFFVTMQVYVAGDHLDGMQAVASGTTSPLGDFLDHYCDLWAGGILVFGFWTLLGTAGRVALFGMETLLVLAFAVTYAEREANRVLHFTRYGTLEAIAILSAFFLSWAVPGARAWWQSDWMFGMPGYTLISGVGSAMAVGAIVVIIWRMRVVPLPVALFASGLAALGFALLSRQTVSPVIGWLIIAAYGATYVGRVMRGHLVPGRRSWPDRVATLAAFGLIAWTRVADPSDQRVTAAVLWLGAYLGVVAAITLVSIVASLRRYWVWINDRAAAT